VGFCDACDDSFGSAINFYKNEIRSIKLTHQLTYFTTHYNIVIGKGKLHSTARREGPEGEKI
jgi:hypothetical protein